MADPLMNPFAFEPARSPISTFHPVAKVLVLVSIAAAIMRVGSIPLLLLFSLGLIGQWGLARHG
ncbi:MAG: hypothetical protein N3A02_03730, partial [Rectinema sp.]|nr:hypothetical protein [Rectinema sp.]